MGRSHPVGGRTEAVARTDEQGSAPRSSSVDRVTLAPDSGSAAPLALSVQLQLKATCPFSVPLHETSCALACSSNSSPAPSMSVAVGAAIVTTGAGVVSRVTV
eukprot:scaffold12162_cov61-Phaeocystis_antarctica.AAC.2